MKGELGVPPSTGSSSTSNNNASESVFPLPYSPPAFAYQPRTPVVSVHTNSYNISTVGNNNSYSVAMLRPEPWTLDEHQRFLHALETYGVNAQRTSSDVIWHAITQAVHTRTLQDVKEHAHQYLVQLQYANVQKRNEQLLMQSIDAGWTLEEDALFEHLLAAYAANDATACYPWELIAAKLPGKSACAVQERYHKLCYDVARIETGHHVDICYGARSAHSKALAAADNASAMSNNVSLSEQAQGWDCVVTLTLEEQSILVAAFEQTRESLHASPDMLESVTSAVAALTTARNKIPPQRVSALFTLEDARAMFQELLSGTTSPPSHEHSAQPAADPQSILELLVRRLRLQPQRTASAMDIQDSSATPATTGAESEKRSAGQRSKPLTTAGLAFGDAPPTPLYNSVHLFSSSSKPTDASQRSPTAEDLLTFRASSSGNNNSSSNDQSGSDSTQRRPRAQQAAASSSAVSPYNLRSRSIQSLFSPSSSGTFSSAPLPSPLSNLVASFTPRSCEALVRSSTFAEDLGDAAGDRTTVKQEATDASDEVDDAAMHDFCM